MTFWWGKNERIVGSVIKMTGNHRLVGSISPSIAIIRGVIIAWVETSFDGTWIWKFARWQRRKAHGRAHHWDSAFCTVPSGLRSDPKHGKSQGFHYPTFHSSRSKTCGCPVPLDAMLPWPGLLKLPFHFVENAQSSEVQCAKSTVLGKIHGCSSTFPEFVNKPGWWFQTCFFPLYMGCHPSHWRTHIFQDGYCTTNQKLSVPIGHVSRMPCFPGRTMGDFQEPRSPRWPSQTTVMATGAQRCFGKSWRGPVSAGPSALGANPAQKNTSWDESYPMCSMVLVYKTGWFLGQMLANIPAPWSIWDGMKDTKRIKNHSKHWVKK